MGRVGPGAVQDGIAQDRPLAHVARQLAQARVQACSMPVTRCSDCRNVRTVEYDGRVAPTRAKVARMKACIGAAPDARSAFGAVA